MNNEGPTENPDAETGLIDNVRELTAENVDQLIGRLVARPYADEAWDFVFSYGPRAGAASKRASARVSCANELRQWELEQGIHFILEVALDLAPDTLSIALTVFIVSHDGVSFSLFSQKRRAKTGRYTEPLRPLPVCGPARLC